MSLASTFDQTSVAKTLGYAIAGSGTALALFDTFRLVSGDLTAGVSLAQNFLTNATAIAGGLGFAWQASKRNEPEHCHAHAHISPYRHRTHKAVIHLPKRELIRH